MLRNTIYNFPKDLNETYEKILAKVLQSSRNDDMRTVLVRVFRWVLGARRPLTVQEIEEAIGLDKNDNYLHFDRVASNSGERLIANCGNLVILNESDSTVAFAHHTVQQYLCSLPSSHPLLTGDVLSLENANHEIGQICLAYLSFSDFETQLIKVATNPVELKKAEDLVWSNVPLGKFIKRTLLSSSKSRESATNIPSEEYIRFPLPTRTQSSDILNRKYVMLDYVISAWIWHTAHLTIRSENWIKFENVATKRNLRFNFRPWNEREHQIKVQQVLSPEKTDWRIPDLISRVEELPSGLLPQDISIHCFMMRHGLRSLLDLVDSTSLVRYIRRYQPPPKHYTLKQCLEVFHFALDQVEPSCWQQISFWNSRFIFDLTIENGYDLMRSDFLLELMSFVRTEHTRWAIPYGHLDLEKIFLEAILLALGADRMNSANLLMRSHVTTPARLVETFLLIIREGHARLQVMHLIFLLPIQSNDLWSSELMWKYLFALHHRFDTSDSFLDLYRTVVAKFNQFTSRALLALSVGVLKSPTMLRRLWRDLPRARNTFVLEEIDWRSQPYGTAELYHALKPLSGSNLDEKVRLLLEISNMFQSKVLNRNDEKLNNAIKEAGSFFSFEAFENDCIPCLLLALDAQCLNVVETLVPMYIDFLQDFKNQEVAIEIIGAIEYSKKDFSSVKHAFALISWPDQVKEPIKSRYETLLHWRGGVNVWIIDMVLAS
ncbi:hypothetical protein IQ07DRAFT_235926 [Pyrenochaeta sp. DS3sAY3a]|nr:hypothetical protein IQ07DRAFT_235926 [Pyrenochaeta sp. DS3sAY3a]